MVIDQIGTIVSVRFRQAWNIYFTYFLLRQSNSQQQIENTGNFLNYSITWEDAEHVYTTLMTDENISKEMNDLSNRVGDLKQRARQIMDTYR
jgi:hypothetical protein